MKASWKGKVEIVTILLADRPSHGIDELDYPGADPNIANRSGATALHFAADKGFTEIVEVLLAAGAKEQPDKKQLLPHQIAQAKGHAHIAALLLARQQGGGGGGGQTAPLPLPASRPPVRPTADAEAGPQLRRVEAETEGDGTLAGPAGFIHHIEGAQDGEGRDGTGEGGGEPSWRRMGHVSHV